MLAGSFHTFPAAELFGWLLRSAQTGSLELKRSSVTRMLHVHAGALTHSSSSAPHEQLSQMLLARSDVTPEALAEAFRVQSQTLVRMGKILVMTEAASEAAIREVLEQSIKEIVFDSLTWTAGKFRFTPGSLALLGELEVAIDLGATLREGLEQANARRAIFEKIPDDGVRFWVVDRSVAGPEFKKILAAIDGRLTARQIALELHGDRVKAFLQLAQLLDLGAIRAERRNHPRTVTLGELSATEFVEAAKGRSAGGDKAGAFGLAKQALDLYPESEELSALFQTLERSLLAELTREFLSKFWVPKLTLGRESLATESLDDAERFIAGRIDGCWDLLSLVRVSPLSEVEALLAIRRLKARGLIEL